eukprot:TRINITY_DN11154_c0_g2_i4.p2 TRINITY_DN11154_c0_g2~~TRINITY_DN11154_c0_g2_i4.p2  ORF type:complete len:124 (+),score=23.82 TRINITY_DN11154_c0_g2_i4:180-551(+)
MTSELDSQTDVQHLKTIATELIKKYPSKIPIICKPAPSSSLPPLHKKTLLADGSLSVGWILGYLRTQLALDKREALFLEVKGKSFPQSYTLKAVYAEHVDEDGFLHLTYTSENVYGSATIISE